MHPWRSRTLVFVTGLTVLAGLLVTGWQPAQAAPLDPVPLQLPNLVAVAPSDVAVASTETPEELRFTTITENRGDWWLDIAGEAIDDTHARASQCVRFVTGTPATECLERRDVGGFVWHPAHGHWHLEDFATYELRTLGADGRPDPSPEAVISTSGKVTFCMENSDTISKPYAPYNDPVTTIDNLDEDADWLLAIARFRAFHCTFESQGISPGWEDIYDAATPGQYVPLTGVPDGTYGLVLTVNPLGNLYETTRSDDTAWTKVRIETVAPGHRQAVVVR